MNSEIVITGQTGTGKTGIALELAKLTDGILLSADSRQVYKDLNIGTGTYEHKEQLTTETEHLCLQGVPIYGVNLLDLDQKWNAGEFADYAAHVIKEARSEKKTPIIVGGTGFYIKSLVYPDNTLHIPIDIELRTRLEAKSVTELREMLDKLDQDKLKSFNSSDVNNPRRLIRAIEVSYLKNNQNAKPAPSFKLDNPVICGLHAPREYLQEKIASRIKLMLASGYQEEVEAALKKSSWESPGMQTIGYKEWRPFLEKRCNQTELGNAILTSHLQYARKQLIFLKRLPGIKWFDISNPDWHKNAIEYCKKTLKNIP